METFLRTQIVALTEQGHASERTLHLDPPDGSAASHVTDAWRGAVTLRARLLRREFFDGLLAVTERTQALDVNEVWIGAT